MNKNLFKFVNRYRSKYMGKLWNIGLIDYSNDIIFSAKHNGKILWLKHSYTTKWFADPFILSESDSDYNILVEEYDFDERKGAIGKITASKDNFELKAYKRVLDLSTHLSFPAIIKHNDTIYLYPENSKSGALNLYKYDVSNDNIEYVKTLCTEPLTDAVILYLNNKFYIISTALPNPNGNVCSIYESNSLFGNFNFKQNLITEDNSARSAGLLFVSEGKIIRPAQDTNGEYGQGLVFQELVLNNDKFELKELSRIYPQDKLYNKGMHTFNRFGDKTIIDGYRYKNRFIKYISDKTFNVILAIYHFIKK